MVNEIKERSNNQSNFSAWIFGRGGLGCELIMRKKSHSRQAVRYFGASFGSFNEVKL